MQDFRAIVGQLGGLVIGECIQHTRFRHGTWIGAHDAVDVRPDPEFGSIQRGRENGCGKIGPAAAQGGRAAIRGSAVKARNYRGSASRKQWPQYLIGFCARSFHYWCGIAEHSVRYDDLSGIDGARREA